MKKHFAAIVLVVATALMFSMVPTNSDAFFGLCGARSSCGSSYGSYYPGYSYSGYYPSYGYGYGWGPGYSGYYGGHGRGYGWGGGRAFGGGLNFGGVGLGFGY